VIKLVPLKTYLIFGKNQPTPLQHNVLRKKKAFEKKKKVMTFFESQPVGNIAPRLKGM
jgi:hypothetical protein